MTFAQLEAMIRSHDLTYSYSDDSRHYNKGYHSYKEIVEAAKEFPREAVVNLWNSIVDTKVIESARSTFYWK